MQNWLKVYSSIGSFFVLTIGAFDDLLKCAIIFMSIDYIAGVAAAVVEKNLSSKIGFTGFVKKIFMVFIIIVANEIDTMLLHTSFLRECVLIFYIANESISIIENASRLGVKIPKKLLDVIKDLNKEESED